ncbi:DUF4199 domain-containing protein [Adhaeribacter pallidiroseus]|uniref:DUF4199 domain-containing protein n=1 Tax=Adhaeribacter pallidiroseus TaxID=2072847 RepID=A0A369QH22_9BACT|nr:DUF4199 domain-containing protein [Adhaeribacter pallidiroseus]RDC63580.1 hypothetical protein AHMF7616_02185 [Adhaeribacter pallidiroseus]
MNATNPSVEKTGFRYGVYAAIAMMIYFLILKLFGLDKNDTVRFLAMIFIVVAATMGIYYFSKHKTKGMFYLNGLGIGFLVGLVGSVLYGIFLFLYSYFIDQNFMADLRLMDFFGSNLSPLMIFGANSLLGIMVGTFTGYITMMYFDRSRTEAKDF